ncbi:MAG: response regulator [Magnetococcales bacterium]|nr:response regulator [Magnetococcales bacterium]
MSTRQKILIVDDERFNINALVGLLSADYKIMVAKDGEQALKAMQAEFLPELILLDIMMPGMSGMEVCRRIKANAVTEAIPIIFLSAMDQTDFKTEGFRLGAVDYIVKPFSPEEVKVRVQTHLALRSLRHSLEEQVIVRTEELRRAMLEAQAAELAKSEFIARISHELRTPLNAIIAPAALLIKRVANPDDKTRLEGIHAAATHLLSLITGLLDFSGLETEPDKSERSFLLDDWIDRIKHKWSPQAARKGLSFQVRAERVPIPTPCVGDIRRLNQAVEQLLDNALKFTDTGGVALQVIPVGARAGHVAFRLEIIDTGIGLRPEDQRRLFTPFTQAESSFTRRNDGMGLGLALTQRLVARLGGQLQVESAPAKGSRFYFTVTFAAGSGESGETGTAPTPTDIDAQLLELKERVENGFRDTDILLSSSIRLWKGTPWSRELLDIADSVHRYDREEAVENIRKLRGQLARTQAGVRASSRSDNS